MTEQFFLLGLLLKIVMTATIVVTATDHRGAHGSLHRRIDRGFADRSRRGLYHPGARACTGLHRRQRGRQHGVERVRNALRLYLRAARTKARTHRQYHRRLCRVVSLRGLAAAGELDTGDRARPQCDCDRRRHRCEPPLPHRRRQDEGEGDSRRYRLAHGHCRALRDRGHDPEPQYRLVRLRRVRRFPGGDGQLLPHSASARRRTGSGQRCRAYPRAALRPRARIFGRSLSRRKHRRLVVLCGWGLRSASPGMR